ncbi:MAG: HD domain-containing phosphohydrolase [Bryobacteraceae bacterium]
MGQFYPSQQAESRGKGDGIALAADATARGPLLVPSQSRILIVDHSQSNRRILQGVLRELGNDLVEASSTSQALRLVANERIDLVLVDLMAPEIGGPMFCRILKSNSSTQFIPIFLLAPDDQAEKEVIAIASGAHDFLLKPLRHKAVQARVQASLRLKATLDSLDEAEAVLFSLAQSVEERDPAMGEHCQRIALLASSLGIALGLPASDLVSLQRGGFLHDIGKVGIPDHILFKSGPLSSEEWVVMREHTVRGERICQKMRSLRDTLPIIRSHHERWNGSGYPDGLRGEEIPLLARIIQIADIFDALTNKRPYKEAYLPEHAMLILQEETNLGWRDPDLVAKFGEIYPMFRNAPPSPKTGNHSLQALAEAIQRKDVHSTENVIRGLSRNGHAPVHVSGRR